MASRMTLRERQQRVVFGWKGTSYIDLHLNGADQCGRPPCGRSASSRTHSAGLRQVCARSCSPRAFASLSRPPHLRPDLLCSTAVPYISSWPWPLKSQTRYSALKHRPKEVRARNFTEQPSPWTQSNVAIFTPPSERRRAPRTKFSTWFIAQFISNQTCCVLYAMQVITPCVRLGSPPRTQRGTC